MMHKIFFSVIIVAGCFYGGVSISYALKQRCDNLKELISAVREMQNCIMAAGMPVYIIYKRLSGTTQVGKMFSYMAESAETDNLKLWEKAMDRISISKEDRKPLAELASGLGSAGREYQTAQMDICLSGLAKQLEEAEEKYNSEGKLCRKLGVYAGILIVLFLI